MRIEEILARIRREITEAAEEKSSEPQAASDAESLPAIAARAELEYLNRNYALFDPASGMHSHRRWLGPLVMRFKRRFRHLVLGVLDRYFEKERLFLLELVRFQNALAERSDRLLRELTERTKAVAERNDLFLGALDLRLEAVEARDQMRRALEATAPSPVDVPDGVEEIASEMAAAFGGGVAERLRPSVARFVAGPIVVLGCGSGEVFAALPAALDVRGVEASGALVAECRARGAAAEQAALGSYLESLPEASLGGLVITRLSERHALAVWPRMVGAAWRALRPGALVVTEGLAEGAAPRLRWLLARQRFGVLEARQVPGAISGTTEEVIVGRKGEGE